MRTVFGMSGVELSPKVIQIRSGHAVQGGASVQDETPPGLVNSTGLGQRFEGAAHHGDAFLYGQEGADVLFVEVEHLFRIAQNAMPRFLYFDKCYTPLNL